MNESYRRRAAMRGIILLAILSLLPLTGCSTSRPRPDWIDNTNAAASSFNFLSATGHHKYPKAAKQQAREQIIGELAFDWPLQTSYTVKDNAATQLITAHRNTLLEQITIADTWVEPVTSQHYVLATLSRADAAASLRDLVTRLDDLTRDQIDRAGSERDPIKRIVLAGTALHAQAMRRRFTNVMKKVYPQRPVTREIWQQIRLEKDYYSLIRRIHIFPLVTRDDSGVLAGSMTEALQKAGFSEGERGSADFQLDVALYFDDRHSDDDGETINARLALQLKDRQRGLRGQDEWKLELLVPGSSTLETAVPEQLKKKFASDLLPTFLGFSGGP